MKKLMYSFAAVAAIALTAFVPAGTKLISKNGHISFYSHTSVEDITANNFKVVSTIETTTGEVVYSVPMQSFEFEKALMQKHFNGEDFLNTKTYPKAKFKGRITNLNDIDFSKDGTYNAKISGELTIKDVTKPITETGTITVNSGKVSADSKMKIVLADYGITFSKGKPSSNIAKEIEVTVKADYEHEQ